MAKRPKADAPPVVDSLGRMLVRFGGAEYVLCPSFLALMEIEAQLGRSSVQLAQQATALALPLMDLSVIIAEMMKAHARFDATAGPSYAGAKAENIAPLVMEAGIPGIMARAGVVLTAAAFGGYTQSGEAKPATS